MAQTIERTEATLIDTVGNTPLLRLQHVTSTLNQNVQVFAKAEYFNPGGSVKDRPALNMVLEAERAGELFPGKTILDATSGNTGIAYAWIGAAKGYPVTLCLPSNASPERKKILDAYGAQLVMTDPSESTDGAQRKAKALYIAEPEKYFYPDQYNNDANWRAHFEYTGPEIWRQTGGGITHFVAGLGTTGTFTGTGRFLKSVNSSIELTSMQPATPLHGLEGMKHLESAIVPGIYDATLADKQATIETEDAYGMCRLLAREEGLFVGVSAGANVLAALRIARELESGIVVTILCDSGDKYLSDAFWSMHGEPDPIY